MGITALSLYRIQRHLKPNSKMLIIGCQNLYDTEHYGEIAHTYFKDLGHEVKSIDILGCQGSEVADLRTDLGFKPIFHMVNDCGSKEHVDGSLWQAFKNIHEACAVGGIMIHENPKTGNWPLHGHHYMTEEFYRTFAVLCRYEMLEITSEAAMGNDVDGWNVCAVLRKTEKSTFPTEDVFNKLDFRKS